MMASSEGFISVVEVLLKHNAQVDLQNEVCSSWYGGFWIMWVVTSLYSVMWFWGLLSLVRSNHDGCYRMGRLR